MLPRVATARPSPSASTSARRASSTSRRVPLLMRGGLMSDTDHRHLDRRPRHGRGRPVSHLRPELRQRAEEVVALYPQRALGDAAAAATWPRSRTATSATTAIAEVAELTGTTPAEVRGTASFYDMFHLEPVGTLRRRGLHEHRLPARRRRSSCWSTRRARWACAVGSTHAPTALFTLEETECLADCDVAPCVPGEPPLRAHDDARRLRRARRRAARRTARSPRSRRTGRSSRVRRSVGLARRRATRSPPSGRAAGAAARRARRGGGLMADARRAARSSPSRLGFDDSHTLDALPRDRRLRRAAQGARDVPRGRRAPRSTRPSLLGRGGAGFPAGRKWSMLRKAAGLVPRGERRRVRAGDLQGPTTWSSATRTSSSRASSSRPTPCRSRMVFVFVRGEFALGLERVQQARQRRLRARRARRATSSARASASTSSCTPAPARTSAARRRRCIEALEGKRGFPRIKPPFFPAVDRPLRRADRREQRRDDLERAVDRRERRRGLRRARRQGARPGTRLFALAGRVRRPGVYEVEMVKNTFRDLIFDPALGGGTIDDRPVKAFIPGGVSAPVVRARPPRPAARPGRGRREGLDARLGLDRRHRTSTTAPVRAAWRITKFFRASRAGSARRAARARAGSSGSCAASSTGGGAPRTSTCCSTCATTSRRGSPGRPSRRRSACSARRSRRRSTRRSRCSATSSPRTSTHGGCPHG